MHSRESKLRFVVPALILAVCATSAFAAVVRNGESPLSRLEFQHSDMYIRDSYQAVSELADKGTLQADLTALGAPAESAHLDSLTGRWATLQPALPLIPGTGVGNELTWAGLRISPPADLSAWQGVAGDAFLGYVNSHAAALRILPVELAPSNVSVNDDGALVQIHVPRQFLGIPVRDSYLTAMINHGNLVLMGAYRWSDIELSVSPSVSETSARDALIVHLEGISPDGSWRESALELVPVSAQGGKAIAYRLVWALGPRFDSYLGQWEALVDAHSGELISFVDTNHYATRKMVGGVYPVSNDGQAPDGIEQLGWPMPFANISTTAGTQTSDSSGHLPIDVGGNISWSGTGPFIRMVDSCGAINESAASGNIDLEGSGGDDCTVPGGGHSSGDTHSSRSGFYELNRIKESARSYLPTNGWLNNQLTSNMNINSSCNAFWNGSTVNFYRSGSGCGNTGELAGVFDHEWGHGLDDNNANGSISNPGEGTADVYAALRLNDPCIGRGFFDFGNCGGYGDPCLDCSGIRNVDFAARQSGLPHDVAWIDANCPVSFSNGPCGTATHCEGTVYAEATWDLRARDLQSAPFNYDSNRALEIATRLHFLGADNVGTWFTCTKNGNDGCGATGGYLQYLGADDDNGNINDGTPHMEAIQSAFDRHGIDCGTPAVVNSGCAGAPTDAPAVTGIAGDRSASLSWGGVPGATEYNIYRTEGVFACEFGKVWIGTTSSTSFTDTEVMNNFDYYYTVAAIGSSDTCIGPMSDCTNVNPTGGGGTLQVSAAGSCPGVTNVDITGATPNGTVLVAKGEALGSFNIPGGGCAGTTLDLNSPSLVATLTANGAGEISATPNLSASLCGDWIQVVDSSSCSVSNTAQLP